MSRCFLKHEGGREREMSRCFLKHDTVLSEVRQDSERWNVAHLAGKCLHDELGR